MGAVSGLLVGRSGTVLEARSTLTICEPSSCGAANRNAARYYWDIGGEAFRSTLRPATQPVLFMDIQAIGQGFGATEVQFTAISDAGKAAMAKIGGFACIGMTVRKSYVGDMLDALATQGVSATWVG